MQFQGGICPEKCQLDQIQNGQLEAIIEFNRGPMGNKGYSLTNVNLIKLLRPSSSSISAIYMANSAIQVYYYCKTECDTSGKNAPCKISITRAGRGIMVAGWPLVYFVDQRTT